ncbi:MAG: hypothetical protein HQK53_13145 [Oligoflexia bacterium]|nr:hypothetical protein [Oligoflexia bacterium]
MRSLLVKKFSSFKTISIITICTALLLPSINSSYAAYGKMRSHHAPHSAMTITSLVQRYKNSKGLGCYGRISNAAKMKGQEIALNTAVAVSTGFFAPIMLPLVLANTDAARTNKLKHLIIAAYGPEEFMDAKNFPSSKQGYDKALAYRKAQIEFTNFMEKLEAEAQQKIDNDEEVSNIVMEDEHLTNAKDGHTDFYGYGYVEIGNDNYATSTAPKQLISEQKVRELIRRANESETLCEINLIGSVIKSNSFKPIRDAILNGTL